MGEQQCYMCMGCYLVLHVYGMLFLVNSYSFLFTYEKIVLSKLASHFGLNPKKPTKTPNEPVCSQIN